MISRRNIRLYYITQLFEGMAFVIPVIIVFLNGVITPVQVSFIYGWRYFVQLISELPTGAIADIFGKKVSILMGMFSFVICYTLLPYATNFWQVLLIYTFSGLGNSFNSGAFEALVYDSLKQDSMENKFQQVMARQNIFYQTGLIIGTLSGGFMYSFDYRLPFWAFALAEFIAFIFSFGFMEPAVDTVKFTVSNYIRQMKVGAREIFKNPEVKRISVFYILVGGITWTCAMYFNSYMFVDLGFGDVARGLWEGSLRFVNLFILTGLLRNEKIFTRERAFLFFPVIMISGLLPGVFLNGYYAIPFIEMSMMAATARWIILGKYTNAEFDSRYRATAISALSMGVGLIYIILTSASGPVIAYMGGVRTVYTILGILSLIFVLPLSLAIVKKNR